MSVMKEDFIAQYMSESCPCQHVCICDGESLRRDAQEAWERRLLNLQRFERDALLAKETFDEGNQAKVPRKDPESDKQASIDGNVKDVKRSAYVLEALRRATNTDSSD